MKTRELPYRVEEVKGCPECGSGTTYAIIGPDEIELSESYGDQDDAWYITAILNDAYVKGRQSIKAINEGDCPFEG
jgi:hypothetical protein